MTDDIDVLKDDLIVALEERNRAEAARDKLRVELKAKDELLSKIQTALDRLEPKIERTGEQSRDIIALLEWSRKQKEEAEARAEELEEALKESDGRVGSMQQDYEAEHERAKGLEAERDKLHGEAAALRTKLEAEEVRAEAGRHKCEIGGRPFGADILAGYGERLRRILASNASAPEATFIKAAVAFLTRGMTRTSGITENRLGLWHGYDIHCDLFADLSVALDKMKGEA